MRKAKNLIFISVTAFTMLSLIFMPSEADAQKNRTKRSAKERVEKIAVVPDTLPFEEAVMQRMWDYVYDTRSEKIYVHTDKESCIVGDTIWFRAYLVSAATNLPVDYSRYIYVDLSDRAGELYRREKVAFNVEDSTFVGYMPISENLAQGEYFLRFYTYWMQNLDDDFIFQKRIRVVNPFDHRISCVMEVENQRSGVRVLKLSFVNDLNEKYQHIKFNYIIPGETPQDEIESDDTGYSGQSRITVNDPRSDHIWIRFSYDIPWEFEAYLQLPDTKCDFEVQFFPEGGALIAGEEQRIGVKSVGRDGKGLAVSGVVTVAGDGATTSVNGGATASVNGASSEEPLVTFTTNEVGIGSFYITADKGVRYSVTACGEDGNEKQFELPETSTNAVALKLDFKGSELQYQILTSPDAEFEREEFLSDKYILIHSRGVPLAILHALEYEGVTLDLSSSPRGLTHIVLIDESGVVYSDRLWFCPGS